MIWAEVFFSPISGPKSIQSLILGRKILRGGRGLEILAARIAATCEQARHRTELEAHATSLLHMLAEVDRTLEAVRAMPPARQLDNAASFQTAFGLLVIGWIWLDQARVAAALPGQDPDTLRLRNGKMATCRHFFECELPQATPHLAQVAKGSDLNSTVDPAIF